MLKTSTILIAAGSHERFYRSMKEVPQGLRKKLLQTTTGANAGTILIADRGGRAELSRALGRLPSAWRRAVLDAPARSAAQSRDALRWRAVAGVLLALLLLLVWHVFARG